MRCAHLPHILELTNAGTDKGLRHHVVVLVQRALQVVAHLLSN